MRRWCHLTASWILIALGFAHLGGHVAGSRQAPANDTEAQLMGLMSTYQFELPGVKRSMLELQSGFSLAFAVLPVVLGVTGLVAASTGRDNVRLLRAMTITYLGGLAILLGISLRYWFLVPTSFIALAFLFYVFSLAKKGIRDTPPPV
jgi:hypothetical protein